MNAISIGPLVFDGQRFAAVVAIVAFLLVVEISTRWRAWRNETAHAGLGVESWASLALIAWIITARFGFVVTNWPEFARHPADMLKLWQGGFSAGWGWAGGIAVLLIALLRDRKAVLVPIATGAVVAFLAHEIMGVAQPNASTALPSMQLTRLDGGTVELAGRGKPVVLNLWATWCPPCRREMPMMVEMAAQSENVDFVFANQGEGADRILAFLLAENLSLDGMVRDSGQQLMPRLGAFGLPSTLVFNAAGELVAAQTGEISRATLSRMIEQASDG